MYPQATSLRTGLRLVALTPAQTQHQVTRADLVASSKGSKVASEVRVRATVARVVRCSREAECRGVECREAECKEAECKEAECREVEWALVVPKVEECRLVELLIWSANRYTCCSVTPAVGSQLYCKSVTA